MNVLRRPKVAAAVEHCRAATLGHRAIEADRLGERGVFRVIGDQRVAIAASGGYVQT